jgi:hypothetical protein
MQNCACKVEFEFGNRADKLVSSLEYMLGQIAPCIPQHGGSDDILFRCKAVITELLTNAIKHAGDGGTRFDVESDGAKLIICKMDTGMPMYLINAGNNSSAENTDEKKRLISADPLSSLYANWESENQIRFTSEEGSLDDFLAVEQLAEHFGILIITNSSDEFIYTYDKHTGENIFRVTINY